MKKQSGERVSTAPLSRTLSLSPSNSLIPMATVAASELSPTSKQRKRAFDALDRRFALARAGILHEEKQKKRKEASNKEKGGKDVNKSEHSSTTTTPSGPKINPPPSSIRGNVSLSGKSSGKKSSFATDNHPAYLDILEGINGKLLNVESILTNRGDIVKKVIYDLLQHGDEVNKFKRTSLKRKMDHCILLDNFVPSDGLSVDVRAKALKSNSKRSKKHMSLRQHRKCGSFDMPEKFHRFDLFKQMHAIWKDYILELMKESR
ncbi:ribonuclease P protein subunit POP4 [Apostasia shenzhenica]|uniref:Ribonuclease P protein subunit POP4 n=1 Tax=Apostasia shenzhenica TaxID=1088818 RepID=A0A2I0ANK2_9ASPA|nr:ribonuclease P protein subunit POP4 [Apostasia shenzhenica]